MPYLLALDKAISYADFGRIYINCTDPWTSARLVLIFRSWSINNKIRSSSVLQGPENMALMTHPRQLLAIYLILTTRQ